MKNRVIALLLAVCMLVSAVPMQVGAAETASITVNDGSTYAGSRVSVSISAVNFESVGSLDLYIYYDSTAMSVYSTTNGSLFTESQVSINTSEAGVIRLSAIDLAGISGSGDLLTVRFEINGDCAAGDYPINVVVGDSYDVDLNEVAISGGSGTLTVQQSQSGTETFSIYGYLDTYWLTQNDLLTINVANTSWTEFASADFVVEYDAELFELDSVAMESALTVEDAVYSINTSMAGVVRISYASNTPVQTFYLFSVKLKVIGDADTTTSITSKALNVYREDLTACAPSESSTTVTLQKKPEVIDHPDLSLETEQMVVGEQSSSVLTLEAGAGVAAADFTLTYDPTVMSCINVTTAEGLSDLGGMLMLNDNYSEGTIKFSYINMDGYSESDIPLIVITWEPLQSPDEHYQTSISGAGVVDVNYNAVVLEYVTDTGCIYVPTVTAPGCVDGGYTKYSCAACGDSYQANPVDATGHSYKNDLFQCDNCDHVREAVSVEIKSLPTKTEYIERAETLDVSGCVVQVTMDDGETISVDVTANMVSDFDNTVIGEQTLTVTVGDASTSFTVTVVQLQIDHIEIISNPDKLTYLEGEAFDPTGMVVVAYYSTGTSAEITDYTVSGYESTPGIKTITVTYEGQSAFFTVTVSSRMPDRITSDTYDIEDGVVLYVLPYITVRELLEDLNEGEYIRVFDGDTELSGDDQVTGSMVLKLMDGDTVKDSCTVLLMGDVNHDGNIDNLDATLVLQYAAGWDVTLDLTAADVCSDGNVDNLDATLILQYAAGWDVMFEVGIAGSSE